MYHFFVKPAQVSADTVEIRGGDVNHIKNVLRMKAGEEIAVSDGFGHGYRCRVESFLNDRVTAAIVERREVSSELPSRIVLFQCLPKSDKMELIVQKAVELGASAVVPVASKRCVVKLDNKKAESKVRRWQSIAEGAAKQSGRAMVPEVKPVAGFAEALAQAEKLDRILFPYECADELLSGSGSGASAMDQTRRTVAGIERGQSVGVFIGPEGGFEKEEVTAALAAGARAVTLGKRILRTETAGLCLLSVLMFQLEE